MLTRRKFSLIASTLLGFPILGAKAQDAAPDQQVPAPEPVQPAEPAPEPVKSFRIALVAPRPGDDYYNACQQGALQAAAEVDGTQLSYTSPQIDDSAQQVSVIEGLVAERYDAIIVSARDAAAVSPACAAAMRAGVRVISIDKRLAPEARVVHIAPPEVNVYGPKLLELMAAALSHKGEVAVISSSPDSEEHAALMKAMQREWVKAPYQDLFLITTVFGNESVQQSYAQTLAVAQAYPGLKGIIAPSVPAFAGAVRAVIDSGRVASIRVTGLGLPSRMASAIQAGVSQSFAMWNPVDLGYAATRIALALSRNETIAQAGAPVAAGRLGELPVNGDGEIAFGELIVFDSANIDNFAEQF